MITKALLECTAQIFTNSSDLPADRMSQQRRSLVVTLRDEKSAFASLERSSAKRIATRIVPSVKTHMDLGVDVAVEVRV